MRILLIGGGGREHALCWKLSQSSLVEQIITVPGNPGTAEVPKNRNVPLSTDDLRALVGFASTEGIDLTVIGPEKPLADGIADLFRQRNLHVFGPSRAAARLEASKQFAKELMAEARIPTASFATLRSESAALTYLERASYPLVLKTEGLAEGKGVLICPDLETARVFVERAMKKKVFGDAGNTLVAERFLEGEEVSFLVVADGTEFVSLAAAQDHKRLAEGDRGPNTGGMGAYSPASVFTPEIQKTTEETIIRPLLERMIKKQAPFLGILGVNLVLTAQGPKVLGFKVRFGDSETQVILPRMETDLAELLYAATRGRLKSVTPRWSSNAALSVVLATQGYPAAPRLGSKIDGLSAAVQDTLIFHAGTKQVRDHLVTAGGRVFNVTALAPTLKEAAQKAYRAADKIHYDGKIFRKDIGWRAFLRSGS